MRFLSEITYYHIINTIPDTKSDQKDINNNFLRPIFPVQEEICNTEKTVIANLKKIP